jgi:hypothetical protein
LPTTHLFGFIAPQVRRFLHRLLLLGFLVSRSPGPCLALKYDTLLIFIFALPIFILALPSISLTVVCHVDQIICGVHHTIIFLPFSVFVAILIQILVLNGLEGEGIL